jgi:hypothetical protein
MLHRSWLVDSVPDAPIFEMVIAGKPISEIGGGRFIFFSTDHLFDYFQ